MPPTESEAAARPIFISHASLDQALVAEIIALLRVGVGLRDEDHFCTSVPGGEVPAGQDFMKRIRIELAGARLGIALITPSYLAREMCKSELSVLAFTGTQYIPVLVDPVTRTDLHEILPVIGQVQTPRLEKAIYYITEQVAEAIGQKPSLEVLTKAISHFQERLPGLLEGIPKGRPVSHDQYERAQRELAEASSRLTELEGWLEDVNKLGAKLNELITDVLPELLFQHLGPLTLTPPSQREQAVSEFELVVAKHAADLYPRRRLRAVVWRYRNGQLSQGRHGGSAWTNMSPRLSADRRKLLEARLRESFVEVWIDDPSKPEQQELSVLGENYDGFPSFALIPVTAHGQDIGLLEVNAPADNRLTNTDIDSLRLLASLLSIAWTLADPNLNLDQAHS